MELLRSIGLSAVRMNLLTNAASRLQRKMAGDSIIAIAFAVGATKALDLAVVVAHAKISTTQTIVVAVAITTRRHRRIVGIRFTAPAGSVLLGFALRFGFIHNFLPSAALALTVHSSKSHLLRNRVPAHGAHLFDFGASFRVGIAQALDALYAN